MTTETRIDMSCHGCMKNIAEDRAAAKIIAGRANGKNLLVKQYCNSCYTFLYPMLESLLESIKILTPPTPWKPTI